MKGAVQSEKYSIMSGTIRSEKYNIMSDTVQSEKSNIMKIRHFSTGPCSQLTDRMFNTTPKDDVGCEM